MISVDVITIPTRFVLGGFLSSRELYSNCITLMDLSGFARTCSHIGTAIEIAREYDENNIGTHSMSNH